MGWLADTIASTDETGALVEKWMKWMLGITMAIGVFTGITAIVNMVKKSK